MTMHKGPIRFGAPFGKRERQKSSNTITGTDNAKRKGGFDGERTRTEARYQKTREARTGLGHCAKVSAAMRSALADYLYLVNDRYHAGRLNGLLVSIKSCDPDVETPKELQRGLATETGRALLLHYAFRKGRRLGANVRRSFVIDLAMGRLVLPHFIPASDLTFPKGTKMMGLQLLLLRIDLQTFAHSFTASEVATFTPGDTGRIDLILEARLPDGNGHLFALLYAGYCDVYRDTLQWSSRLENTMAFVAVDADR